MNKKLTTALDYLGDEYRTQLIDFEECIYRNLGNGFDIEVSGINSKHECSLTVYVWDMKHRVITERVSEIADLKELKPVLDSLIIKYKEINK